MARPLRINYPGAFYHVTSRGNEQKSIFKSTRDRIKFLEYLESATIRYDAKIHVHCQMTNHYHLLIETPAGNLSQIMRHINGAYTSYFNTKRDRCGHLFQGRYKAILVEADEYAQELSRYIHLNPVRAKIVDKPEEYKWSSYQDYIGMRKAAEWLTRDFILSFFGKKTSIAQKDYKKFVDIYERKKYENPLKDVVASTILGGNAFVDYVKENYLDGHGKNPEIPATRLLSYKISLENIFEVVENEIADIRLARDVKLYLSQKYTAEKLNNIGSHFDVSGSAVSHACRRIVMRIETDGQLRRKIKKIVNKLSHS